MRFENGVFRLFIFWYIVGVILLSFDLLPSWLEWANAVFLILSGMLGALYFTRRFGTAIGLSLSAFIFLSTFIVEGAGAKTDFLFGSYDYTERFAPSVFGVPIAIGFAWIMVVATSHVAARWMFPKGGVLYALAGGIGAVIMDLIIDPVAYQVKGYWIWEDTGWYYGIPWTNFFGWFVVSFVLHLIIDGLMKRKGWNINAETPEKRMLLLYGLMIAMFILLGFIHGLWLAAIGTSILTAGYLTLAWSRKPA